MNMILQINWEESPSARGTESVKLKILTDAENGDLISEHFQMSQQSVSQLELNKMV